MIMHYSRRPKYTVLLEGGIGNQLFQFFAVLTLAKSRGADLCVDDSFVRRNFNGHGISVVEELSKTFDFSHKHNLGFVTFKFLNILRRLIMLGQKIGIHISVVGKFYFSPNRNFKESFLNLTPGKIIRGYFQSSKLIDQELVWAYRDNFISRNLIEQQNVKGIAIHIRGGDYRQGNAINGVIAIEYYASAISAATSGVKVNCELHIYTDDLHYAQGVLKNLRIDKFKSHIYTSSSFENDFDSLRHMSSQEVIIMANSTFSLWSSYLSSSQEIYAPSQWDLVGTDVSELYLPKWNIINAELFIPIE